MGTNKKKRSNNNNKKKKCRTEISSGDANGNSTTNCNGVKTSRCTHGSKPDNFLESSNYQKVIYEMMSIMMNTTNRNPTERASCMSRFMTKHDKLIKDPEFIQHVFALSTHMFLIDYGDVGESSMAPILRFGFMIKYYGSIENVEKCAKYCRDIDTKRGIINCLARETLPFCHCMMAKKMEAKRMEKLGVCFGCDHEFPKTVLKLCARCLAVQYCSNDCMKKNWSRHKHYCNK